MMKLVLAYPLLRWQEDVQGVPHGLALIFFNGVEGLSLAQFNGDFAQKLVRSKSVIVPDRNLQNTRLEVWGRDAGIDERLAPLRIAGVNNRFGSPLGLFAAISDIRTTLIEVGLDYHSTSEERTSDNRNRSKQTNERTSKQAMNEPINQ